MRPQSGAWPPSRCGAARQNARWRRRPDATASWPLWRFIFGVRHRDKRPQVLEVDHGACPPLFEVRKERTGTPNLSQKSELAAKMALGSLGTSGGKLRGSLRHAANMCGQSNGVCAGCMRSASNQPVFMEHCTIRSMPIPHVHLLTRISPGAHRSGPFHTRFARQTVTVVPYMIIPFV